MDNIAPHGARYKKKAQINIFIKRIFVTLAAASLGGCMSGGLYVPDMGPDPIEREAATTETGSRINRGKAEAVRDSPQRIDVLTEQELEKQRPVNTQDAVRRATRGF